MTDVYSSADVRYMDRAAIESGISSLTLMNAAAAALFDTLEAALGGVAGRRVVVFAGAGNNGGDGFALATRLLLAGCCATVVFTGRREDMSPDCGAMYAGFIEADGEVADFNPECAKGADAVVDAMYGTGFRGTLTGPPADAAALICAFPGFRLAADLPSGIYSDHGGMAEGAVHADATVTFSFPKPSCLLMPAAAACGRLIVADIGIPPEITARCTPVFRMTDEDTLRVLPKRERGAHKGKFGHALIVAGSARYTGAPVLAARAAEVSGAGRVTCALPSSAHAAAAFKLDGAMAYRLPDEDRLAGASLYDILSLCSQATAVLLGPGLGREEATAALVRDLLTMISLPVVFDADGINALEGHIDILPRMAHTPVLTPHDAEFARAFGAMPPEGARARLLATADAAKRSGGVVVLKGHRTVIAAPDGSVAVNSTGNPGMAKGGSGDVLAGIIVSFLSQGVPAFEAACAAVWLHGAAGDECAREIGEYGMTPADMIRHIPGRLRSRDSIRYF